LGCLRKATALTNQGRGHGSSRGTRTRMMTCTACRSNLVLGAVWQRWRGEQSASLPLPYSPARSTRLPLARRPRGGGDLISARRPWGTSPSPAGLAAGSADPGDQRSVAVRGGWRPPPRRSREANDRPQRGTGVSRALALASLALLACVCRVCVCPPAIGERRGSQNLTLFYHLTSGERHEALKT
jgi:hypothetical protein